MTQSAPTAPTRLRLPEPPADGPVRRLLDTARYEPAPAHRLPSPGGLAVATVTALVVSIAADWAIAAVVQAVAPSTKGYEHFHFGDYATLTVLGVLAACAGWPLVVRACRAPRWLFTRLAVLVSAVLLLPDVAILFQNQPAAGVAGLMVMHVAIAVVTYLALTRIAPERA